MRYAFVPIVIAVAACPAAAQPPAKPNVLFIAVDDLRGWVGYLDAAAQEWLSTGEPRREQLRDMLVAVFAAALAGAQRADPKLNVSAALQ